MRNEGAGSSSRLVAPPRARHYGRRHPHVPEDTMPRTPVARVIPLVGIASLLLAGCAAAPEQSGSSTQAGSGDYCARMVTNSGGLEDRSFNQTSWAGLQKAS